jgi:hypothetical protein
MFCGHVFLGCIEIRAVFCAKKVEVCLIYEKIQAIRTKSNVIRTVQLCCTRSGNELLNGRLSFRFVMRQLLKR